MASGKTGNYELNQWQESDRILMEEFNADNARIDAALKAIRDASPLAKLMEITTTQDAAQVDLDLSGIDMSQYAALEIYGQTMGASVFVRVNNRTSFTTRTSYSGASNQINYILYASGSASYTTRHHITFSGMDSNPLLGEMAFANSGDSMDGGGGCVNLPAGETLQSVNYYVTSNTLKAGAKFLVYGVRK